MSGSRKLISIGVIIFDSVWFLSKKITNLNFKKTETEPKLVQTDRFWFGFLGQKTVQIGLARFFFQFFFDLGSVRFSFFSFRLIKPKPNQTEPVGFFKILIGLIEFFSWFVFFRYYIHAKNLFLMYKNIIKPAFKLT